MLTGKHFVAGQWLGSDGKFLSDPVHGSPLEFCVGTVDLVDSAADAAENAFLSYGQTSGKSRAAFLRQIAAEIDARGDAITAIGSSETGLPEARLIGERGRTVMQLRLFADHIEGGSHLDKRHDPALPDRKPQPRPEIALKQRPIGPVAVFGASNFPLAFSVAGGDTAAALAAGCPVVVKGHSAHPGTGELVAQAVEAAIKACGLPDGVFSLIQGGRRDVGSALVQHPLINAVGFTGSLAGGRALFDLCASRENPIPFYGELGSVNPMFILPSALASRGEAIAKGWAASLTMGAGQFCTKPGVGFLIDGLGADELIASLSAELSMAPQQHMLTMGISDAYVQGIAELRGAEGVRMLNASGSVARTALPALFETSGANWLENEALSEEVFGPLGIVVRLSSFEEMHEVATKLKGQLTATLHMGPGDLDHAKGLLPVLERKAGRVLANGFPTGVEVCDAMVHGGPYPASTNFGATSVGTLSIRRFLRPVSYQNLPAELLS
ncbi:aldehyde dehydrogenase (NADP(+)) [Roseibium sp. CAU 1637]|uniref:Aldehyde dehydrogenase (NADP(+)) n=1 Tax=Roseibium limicola TaxID=2816037 RepID=A0A939EQW7_9HYPH|nr:aldehyde dehydrogenase (NADP(+)) [Roseibium limicola]MBO0347051.1 aldehyde dehydrogenase (NADP(+)) [Roseibium limicola]